MATIYASEVLKRAVNELKLAPAREKIPTELADKVLPVYAIHKKYTDWVITAASSATGTITATTSSIPGDVYITGIQCSMIKDAACDQATGPIAVSLTTDEQATSKNIIQMATITLTAQSENVCMMFPFPIKIKTGVSITMNATYAAGTMSRTLSVMGFNLQ